MQETPRTCCWWCTDREILQKRKNKQTGFDWFTDRQESQLETIKKPGFGGYTEIQQETQAWSWPVLGSLVESPVAGFYDIWVGFLAPHEAEATFHNLVHLPMFSASANSGSYGLGARQVVMDHLTGLAVSLLCTLCWLRRTSTRAAPLCHLNGLFRGPNCALTIGALLCNDAASCVARSFSHAPSGEGSSMLPGRRVYSELRVFTSVGRPFRLERLASCQFCTNNSRPI